MRGLIGYIWSICSNGSLIKEKFSVVWWSISMEFVEFIQGSLISKFFSCTYLAESLTVRFELFYCTHNLNTPVGRCDVPIERQPLIRGASWKVLHDRSSSNVNVWWTGKTENRISSAEGEVRSSGERESRFIHEFSVRWRRKITPNSWLRVSLTKGVRKEKKKTPISIFHRIFRRTCASSPSPPPSPPSPGKYLSGILFPRNLFPLTHPVSR